MLKKLPLLIIIFLFKYSLIAQTNTQNVYETNYIKQGIELYKEEKYIESFQFLNQVYHNFIDKNDYTNLHFTECVYYYIMAGITCNQPVVFSLIPIFLENNISQTYNDRLRYKIGNYYYSNNNYKEALNYYGNLKKSNLTNKEILILTFQLGYIYYNIEDYDNALKKFNIIVQIEGNEFYYDANYYGGLIEIKKNNFNSALNYLKKANETTNFKDILPYYFASIYYNQGNFDEALTETLKAINNAENTYLKELNYLLAQIYFEKKMYIESLKYYEKAIQFKLPISNFNLFRYSICLFENKQYDKSLQILNKLKNNNDTIQNEVLFLMANIYLVQGNNLFAKNSFIQYVSNNIHNKKSNKILLAKFNIIKLMVDLNEFYTAIQEIKQFEKQYPHSIYSNEVSELYTICLTNTNDFEEAYKQYKKLNDLTLFSQKSYCTLLFGLAITYINQHEYDSALPFLNKLIEINTIQNKFLNNAYFWKAEILYKKEKYNEAIVHLKKILNKVDNDNLFMQKVNYNIGYNYLKILNYKEALHYFNLVKLNNINNFTELEKDAYTKMGDCYFMLKDFKEAKNTYNIILKNNWGNSDYILFQKAILAGTEKNVSEKITLLNQTLADYPTTNLKSVILLELAQTYIINEEFERAIQPLKTILQIEKNNDFYIKGLYNLGIVYYNINNSETAIAYFKELIQNYPNSIESKDVIEIIRKIYIDKNKPEDFINFMVQNNMSISVDEQDKLLYQVALDKKEDNQLDEAIHAFKKYITIPSPQKLIEAYFEIAQLYQNSKNIDSAIVYFDKLTFQNFNNYYIKSNQIVGNFYLEKKQYFTALKYFQNIYNLKPDFENTQDAISKILTIFIQTASWDTAQYYASLIEKENNHLLLENKQKINYILGCYAINKHDTTEAFNQFQQLVESNSYTYSPIATYYIALILFQQLKYQEAENLAFTLIKKYTYSTYWIIKSYILLGDIYFAQNDLFNAESTYKSVVNNSNSEMLKQEAQEKLNQVLKIKNMKKK